MVAMKRLFLIAVIASLSACVTMEDSTERVSGIVSAVLETSTKGFSDIRIDYVKYDLIVSGHAYSGVQPARLLKAMENAGAKNLKLQAIHLENRGAKHTFAFTIVESGVGKVRNWSEPVVLNFPYPENSSAASRLGDLPLKELAFVDALFNASGEFAEVLIESPDKRVHRILKGERIGSENAVIEEVVGHVLIMRMPDGLKFEMRLRELN